MTFKQLLKLLPASQRKKVNNILAVLAIGLLILSAVGLIFPDSQLHVDLEESPQVLSETDEQALVVRVIDGDTVELEGGRRLRYIGINTPENTSQVECFGEEAQERNRQLVEGRVVRLEKDVSETDRYGRLLRYVYIDDIFVNEVLVEEGFAEAASYPPDIKYQDKFRLSERLARSEQRGLWGSICGDEFGQN